MACQFTVFDSEGTSPLAKLWAGALRIVEVRHPDPECTVQLEMRNAELTIRLRCRDTANPDRWIEDFVFSCIRFDCWPGEFLARAWLSAAWAGCLQHEALELVTVDGIAVLNPHAEPYPVNPYNRGVRDGMPFVLTQESLTTALTVAMTPDHAHQLVREHWPIGNL